MNVSDELRVPLSTAPVRAVEERGGESTSWLFLSFYLLLFAFFMVLNSFSSFESGKRDAVISSVLDAFAQVESPGDQRDVGGIIGSESQSRQFQDSVTAIFETAIPLDSVRVVVPGSRLDVDVPSAVFFDQDSVTVRDPFPMMDRIIATVSSPPEGVTYELAVIAYIPVDDETPLPTTMTSQVARVGNIARALNAKGMPPQATTIGLERGDDSLITLVFFAVEGPARSSSAARLWDGEAL